ncbi:hypothetical protein F5Y08DRAFT_334097 [Xylaria arbuscula]|nr:hypothetical protein F5Y08DRAFT_334097 [Xylaria arbuscula]
MGKRMKNKPNIDYRHRWPTQQTLVESRATLIPRFKWRWKTRTRWLRRRLARRPAPKPPGKSTHPYDTGLGDSGDDDSRSGSAVIGPPLTQGDQKCFKLFNRTPQAAPPPTPVIPKISLIKEEPRPETPKTPVQLLRQHLNRRTKKSSPLPRSRNATPIVDSDKPAIRCSNCRVPVHDLELPKTARPAAKNPKRLSTKIRSIAQKMFGKSCFKPS